MKSNKLNMSFLYPGLEVFKLLKIIVTDILMPLLFSVTFLTCGSNPADEMAPVKQTLTDKKYDDPVKMANTITAILPKRGIVCNQCL